MLIMGAEKFTRSSFTSPAARARPGRRSEECVLLDLEQRLLALDAAGVPGQGAVGSDHPVARDDDRDRVAAVGESDGPGGGVGLAEPLRDLAVRRGVAVPDLQQLTPDGPLEVAPLRVEREIELLEVTVEVGIQLAHGLDQDRVGVVAVSARTSVVVTA